MSLGIYHLLHRYWQFNLRKVRWASSYSWNHFRNILWFYIFTNTFFNWKQKEIKQGQVTSVPAPQVNHSRKQSSWMDTEHLAADEGKIERQAKFFKQHSLRQNFFWNSFNCNFKHENNNINGYRIYSSLAYTLWYSANLQEEGSWIPDSYFILFSAFSCLLVCEKAFIS